MHSNQCLVSRTTRSLLPTTKQALMPKIVQNASVLLEPPQLKKTEFANKHMKKTSYTTSLGDHGLSMIYDMMI